MIVSDWVDRDERLPTEADADVQGCVIVWHVYNGVMITGWFNVPHNRFISHWMPAIPRPENIDPKYKQR